MNKEKIGIICVVISQVLFGFSFLFTKSILNAVSPMTLLSWRFLFAFILMNICALTGIIKISFRNKPILPLFLVAIFQPVSYFVGESIGIKLTTATESGTLIACIPITTLLFSALILKEAPKRLQVFGIIVTIIGILLNVLAKGLDVTFNPIGYIMLLVAVASASLYAVFSRKAVQYNSAEKTYAMMGLGAIVFTTYAVAEHAAGGSLKEYILLPFTNMDFLIAILYLGAGCSVVAFLLYNTAIAGIGTNRTASFVGITTVVTVTAGVIILREKYTILQGLGAALVLAGVYMANASRKQEPALNNVTVE